MKKITAPKETTSQYQKISVIVPCFNEGNRILPVIASIKKSSYVGEIIVVDDSSEPETLRILQSIKGIVLITLSENRGKALALKIGVQNARTETVMFIDSDLKNLTYENINDVVKAFFANNYDMVIGVREKEWVVSRLTGMAITLAGERIIKKQLLLKHMDLFDAQGYLIESAINRLFFKKYNVGKVLLKNVGQWWKIQKNGVAAITQDILWMFRYVQYLGLREFMWQLYFAIRLRFIT